MVVGSSPVAVTYVHEVRDYRKGNVKSIQKSIQTFDWVKAFGNLSVYGKVDVLNETLMNIFRNYIANKKIKRNYCQPPRMNDKIKKCLRERSKLTKFYYKHGQKKKEDQEKVQAKAACCIEEILKAKNDYILRMTSKLNDPKTSPKAYWPILNQFLYNKKIPLIPPFFVNKKSISDFRVKTNLFNGFFASICTPINNGSTLPQFAYQTNVKINSFRVNQNDISLIIKTLDAEKAHGWDNISIKMIHICGDPIALPLMLVFEMALKEKKFPDIWKKANVVTVHKKEENDLLRNYRPISLLSGFSKVFERIIYNSLFNHLIGSKRFTPSQSGFLPRDSCIAQLLAIIHKIQTNFDSKPPADVRGVFLDISKAFDKVWHKGLLFKLKSYGVEVTLFIRMLS